MEAQTKMTIAEESIVPHQPLIVISQTHVSCLWILTCRCGSSKVSIACADDSTTRHVHTTIATTNVTQICATTEKRKYHANLTHARTVVCVGNKTTAPMFASAHKGIPAERVRRVSFTFWK
ncbi:hypothetical protein NP493_295g07003 [Ridgeia piscesae]|uniref:Uncharacterized protein n=1 Tax=Ridgeia piscesae TaxID=27915 RepID=A0AAD9UC35_RIDPI|nr:hypothetical protein NP493_295g07003 [Ridgeia piscesae]